MKKLLLLLSLLFMSITILFAQTTFAPMVKSCNNDCIIDKVELTDEETIITIKVRRGGIAEWVSFSSYTVLVPSDGWLDIFSARHLNVPENASSYQEAQTIRNFLDAISVSGYLIRNLGTRQLDKKYWFRHERSNEFLFFELHFDKLPVGCEDFYIRELQSNGFEWTGIQISNPYPEVPNIGLNEFEIKQKIDESNAWITGIYECSSGNGNKYKLACIEDSAEYKLIYLGSNNSLKQWHLGDIKAILMPSGTADVFKANWYMANKTPNNNVYVTFAKGQMKIIIESDEDTYIKMYPSMRTEESAISSQTWSGTGFALKNGYIVTNYHVVDNATSIFIQGTNGSLKKNVQASVVAVDKINDLALLKVSDSAFIGFSSIPYSIQTSVSEVGEDIFVLGYPLISTMGDEIKLTTGIISSKSGFLGDMALYQISAPIQPGNSGGPVFNNKGNLIGIVTAKHKGTENVGYAIKTSYLNNLVESSISTSILPTNNQLTGLSLSEKVKKLKNCVFMIICSGN
jgi:S1-C subfamily serine protease